MVGGSHTYVPELEPDMLQERVPVPISTRIGKGKKIWGDALDDGRMGIWAERDALGRKKKRPPNLDEMDYRVRGQVNWLADWLGTG